MITNKQTNEKKKTGTQRIPNETRDERKNGKLDLTSHPATHSLIYLFSGQS